jgi:hypothetical protein
VPEIRREIGAESIADIRVNIRAGAGAIDAGRSCAGTPAHRGKLLMASDMFTFTYVET